MIVIVEDDPDDQLFLEMALDNASVKNPKKFFQNPHEAFDFLKTTNEPLFIIISDVNMPAQNGIEFKRRIDQDPVLRQKSIPFVFLSTSVDKASVDKAYTELTVQGFFRKPDAHDALEQLVRCIFSYWKVCRHPNSHGV